MSDSLSPGRSPKVRDLSTILADHIEANPAQFDKEFSQMATDGVLASSRLPALVNKVVISTDPEGDFIRVMIELGEETQLGLQDVIQVMRSCAAVAKGVELEKSLEQINKELADAQMLVSEAFELADTEHRGVLDVSQTLLLLKDIVPTLGQLELRRMLSYLWESGFDGQGGISNSALSRMFMVPEKSGVADEVQSRVQDSADASGPVNIPDEVPQRADAEEEVEVEVEERIDNPRNAPERLSVMSDSVLMGSAKDNIDLPVWKLQRYEFLDHEFLVDMSSKLVYSRLDGDGFPMPYGELMGTAVVRTCGARDLFRELDVYMKEKGVKLRRLFEEFDTDGTDRLERNELYCLLAAVLPGASEAEQGLFDAMIDIDGKEDTTYDRFFKSIDECKSLGSMRSAKGMLGVERAMSTLHKHIQSSELGILEAFAQLDIGGSGYLSLRLLLELVKELAPAYENIDLRYCLLQFHASDGDRDGRLSLREVLQCLRLVEVQTTTADASAMGRSSCDNPLPWKLVKHIIGGEEFLVDPETQGVFLISNVTGKPFPHGNLDGPNVISQGHGQRDLFQALDAKLQDKPEVLQDAFDRFDMGKTTCMNTNELHRVLSSVLSDTSATETLYFAAMVDIHGEGEVAFHDLVECISHCRQMKDSHQNTAEIEKMMLALHDLVEDHGVPLKKLCNNLDFNRNACLDYRELGLLLSSIVSTGDKYDLRLLMKHFQLMDIDNDSCISYEEIMHALCFVVLDISNEVVRTASQLEPVFRKRSSTKDAIIQWSLTARVIGGKECLVDEELQLVYNMSPKTGQPILKGKLLSTGEVQDRKSADLFLALDSYLKEKRARLQTVFETFDASQSGHLQGNELQALLKDIRPESSPADMRYFSTMLDIDGDGHVAFDEMMEGIRESKRIAELAADEENIDIDLVIQSFNDHIRQTKHSVKVAFDNFDADGSGFLEAPELSRLIHALLPSMTRKQGRTIMRYFHEIDCNGDGRISYPELMKALHFAKVSVQANLNSNTVPPLREEASAAKETQLPRAKSPVSPRSRLASSSNSRLHASASQSSLGSIAAIADVATFDMPVWKMMERVLERNTYLIDPQTSRVYSCPTGGGLPVLRGKVMAGSLKREMHPRDVLQPLATAVRERWDRLKVLFNKYDLDLSGKLDLKELGSLLTSFMPGITESETRFCQMVLDSDGDKEIELEEMRKAAQLNAELYSKTDQLLSTISRLLPSVAREIAESSVNPRAEFEKLDTHTTGSLDFTAAAEWMRKLAPSTKPAQRRTLLAYMYYCDFDAKGRYTYLELMQCNGLVKVVVEGATSERRVAVRRKSTRQLGSQAKKEVMWKLVDMTIKGSLVWVDRETNLAYTPAPHGHWPRMCGKLTGVNVMDSSYIITDLFNAMDRFLKERKMQLERLFRKYDWNRTGSLETSELSNFLMDLMPAATEVEGNYFRVMMNIKDSQVQFDYDQFVEALAECTEATLAVSGQTMEFEDAIQSVHTRLKNNDINIVEVFDSYDHNGDDELELWELNSMVQALVPSGSTLEKRILLCQISHWDLDYNGKVSYSEVMRALQLASIRVSNSTADSTAQKGVRQLQDWRLKRVQVMGQTVLLDRQSGMGFKESPHDGYPVFLGLVRSGQLVPSSPDLELFASLEPFLAERKVRMREAFSCVDWGGSGHIRSVDFGLFLQELLPTSTKGDQLYFETMLDAGQNKGSVTYVELSDSLQECLRISMAVHLGGDQVMDNIEALIVDFSEQLKYRHINPADVFDESDTDGSGFLDFRELAVLILQLQPSLNVTQIRFMVAHMRLWDVHDEGRMSFTDFTRAFRLTNIQIEKDKTGTGGRSVSSMGMVPNLYSGTTFNPGSVSDSHRMMSNSGVDFKSIEQSGPRAGGGSRSQSHAGNLSFSSNLRSGSMAGGGGGPYGKTVSSAGGYLGGVPVDRPRAQSVYGGGSRQGSRATSSTGRLVGKTVSFLGGVQDTSKSYPPQQRAYSSTGATSPPNLSSRSLSTAGTAGIGRGSADRFKGRQLASLASMKIVSDDGTTAEIPEKMIWHLEEIEVEGARYLYDCQTDYVYQPSKRTGYPDLVGRVCSDAGGRVNPDHNLLRLETRSNWGDIFQLLVELVRSNRGKLEETFNRFDYDNSRALDGNEITQFVTSTLPRCSMADATYFKAVLGLRDTEQIRFDAMVELICAAARVGDSIRRKEDSIAEGLITKVAANVETYKISVPEVFSRCDSNKSGRLDFMMVRKTVLELFPSLTNHQIRYILCHLYYQDLDGSGQLDLHELSCRLRLAMVTIKYMDEVVEIGSKRTQASLPSFIGSGPERSITGVFSASGSPRQSTSGFYSPRSTDGIATGATRSPIAQSLRGSPSPSRDGTALSPSPKAKHEMRHSGHAQLSDWEHDWRLETFSVPGNASSLLVDPQDGKVFEVQSVVGSYPNPIGKLLENGKIEDNRRARDIFTELKFFVQENRVSLRSKLDAMGTGNSLSRGDLRRLLTALVPDSKACEEQYFESMINIEQSGKLSEDEVIVMIDECSNIANDIYTGQSQELEEILQKVGLRVLGSNISIFTAVSKFATSEEGNRHEKYISCGDQAQMLRMLHPSLSDRDLRYLLAHLSTWDLDCAAKLKYSDIVHALRLARLTVLDVTESGALGMQEYLCLENFRPVVKETRDLHNLLSTTRVDRARQVVWELTAVISNRLEYLWDQETDLIYKPGFTGYPQIYGQLSKGQIQSFKLMDTSNHILFALSEKVDKNIIDLNKLFSLYDFHGEGKISADSLQRLVKKALPNCRRHDMLYFQTMMDIGGQTWLSCKALATALGESAATLRTLLDKPSTSEDVTEEFEDAMESRGTTMRQLWDRADTARHGYLDYKQIVVMLKGIAPGITNHQLRVLLHLVYANDPRETMGATFEELHKVMQLAHVVINENAVNLDKGKPVTGKDPTLQTRRAPQYQQARSEAGFSEANSSDLASAFGHSVRLSANFCHRGGLQSRASLQSLGRSHTEGPLEVTTRIDPEADAVVMAGGIDVSTLSSSKALARKTDLTKRHTMMAEESQSQLDGQGDIARKTMDASNGAHAHVRRTLPEWMSRRQNLKAGVHNGAMATVITSSGETIKGLLTDVEFKRGVALRPFTYDQFGDMRSTTGMDKINLSKELSQTGLYAAWKKTSRQSPRETSTQRSFAGQQSSGTSGKLQEGYKSASEWNDFINPPVIFESNQILRESRAGTRSGSRTPPMEEAAYEDLDVMSTSSKTSSFAPRR